MCALGKRLWNAYCASDTGLGTRSPGLRPHPKEASDGYITARQLAVRGTKGFKVPGQPQVNLPYQVGSLAGGGCMGTNTSPAAFSKASAPTSNELHIGVRGEGDSRSAGEGRVAEEVG